jgi:transketolase
MTKEIGQALRVTFGETVSEMADTDPRIVMVDGDVGNSTRADIFEEAHGERFFQMGIAEQNMLGVAAGMATLGLVPFVSTFACFAVARPLDTTRVLIAQPNLGVKIMGAYTGLLAGMTGKTHLIFDDVSVMRAMANMTVVAPGDDIETRQALHAIVEMEGPVYMRLTRQASPRIFNQDYRFDLTKAVVVRDGSDVTLISSGVQTTRVLEAAEMLADNGIDAHVLHVPTIRPIDVEGVVAAAERTGFVITIEEHTIIGGLGGAVAETLAEHAPTRMRRHGIMDTFGESGPDDALLEKYRLSAGQVATVVSEHLETRPI